jgi:hypothetical protein
MGNYLPREEQETCMLDFRPKQAAVAAAVAAARSERHPTERRKINLNTKVVSKIM